MRETLQLTHLDELEAEAVHIMREVAAELERPVLLFSGGKDSTAVLQVALEVAHSSPEFERHLPLRVVHFDDGPIAIEQLALPASLVPRLAVADLESGNFYRLLRKRFGIVVQDAVQTIEASAEGPAMDKYLWGIAEVPASFPPEALKAQAVAARTYAAKRGGRVLMPTPADQNYTGWKKETEGTDGVWGARWRSAVDATSGQVVALAGGGPLIDAFYS